MYIVYIFPPTSEWKVLIIDVAMFVFAYMTSGQKFYEDITYMYFILDMVYIHIALMLSIQERIYFSDS